MMRNLMLCIIVMMLVISPSIVLAGKSTYKEVYSFSFSNLKVVEKRNYVEFSVNGATSTLVKPYHYKIPVKSETIILPFGAKINSVKFSVEGIHFEEIRGEPSATPPPVIKGSHVDSYEFTPVTVDRWIDYDVGVGVVSQNERGVYLKINIYPVKYHSDEEVVEWAEKIEVEIEYTTCEYLGSKHSDEERYDLLILTPVDFIDELTPLVEHKISKGISTKLVTLGEIYGGVYFPVKGRDDPEKIKYFIFNAVENWSVMNVLLVGGKEWFPVRYTHIHVYYPPNPPDDEVFVSDLYYADIYNETFGFSSWDTNNNDVFGEYKWGKEELTDEVDLYPDVHLGRLACVSEDEVKAVVNKIITYETIEAYKQDWFTNIVLCGGDTSPGDPDGIDEGEYICGIVGDILDSFTPTEIYASNGKLWNRLNIDNAIDRGASFVVLSGHGLPKVWATHPHENPDVWIPVGDYKSIHASKLTNGEKLPIVVTDACSPFKFSVADDCLGWAFVSNPDGGAIAGFGCTGLSWGEEGYLVSEFLTAKLSLDTFRAYNRGAITFGEMWSRGLCNYIHPDMDCGDHKSVEEWEPFGDPTLAIAKSSTPPEKPVVGGPCEGKPGVEYTFNATTIDPDGDKIYYMFDWGDGSYSDWIGPVNSGEMIQAFHAWTGKGLYEVRVKAKDEHGVQSLWSDPLPVRMSKKFSILENFLDKPFISLLLHWLSPHHSYY